MNEVFARFLRKWQEYEARQRHLIIIGCGIGLALLIWLALPHRTLVPLSPYHALSEGEKQNMRHYLEKEHIPFEERGELLVSAKHVEQLRHHLSEGGGHAQKQEQGKGFELFDTNTWIKGEKELQVLEMRALKGQLEHDLAQFENIKQACVILDLAPARTFGASSPKTKASVILTLMPNAHLKASQLRAICYHLSGAVRGLEPHRVAISDTTGRLYQAIASENADPIADDALVLAEEMEQKISSLLEKIMGKEHIHVSVQFPYHKEEAAEPSVAILLNKNVLQQPVHEEVSRQVEAIGRGYGLHIVPTIDIVPFEMDKEALQASPSPHGYLGIVMFGLMLGVAIGVILPLMRLWKRWRHQEEEDPLFKIMTKVDISKLAQSLQTEDPETLALMLAYLEPQKAQAIIAALPYELQKAVLHELEKSS